MPDRSCLPGEMLLDAVVYYPNLLLDRLSASVTGTFAQSVPFDADTIAQVHPAPRSYSLRWVLNPALGIPLEPFTVWRRSAHDREPLQPIQGWRLASESVFVWDRYTEMLIIELEVSEPVTAVGLTADGEPVIEQSGSAPLLSLGGAGPMLGVRVNPASAVVAARGLPMLTMANGDGWEPFETVGLPLGPDHAGQTYYSNTSQGPLGAETDAVSAAIARLRGWGPVLGWAPLAGLPPWRPPDAAALVEQLQGDILRGLVEVMRRRPPPELGRQHAEELTEPLASIGDAAATVDRALNTPGGEPSEMRWQPVQSLAMAVASDTWASLALGFGTGAPWGVGTGAPAGAQEALDFMVTTRWSGRIRIPVTRRRPWPFLPRPEEMPPEHVESDAVDREIAAVVLSPRRAFSPSAPDSVDADVAVLEGARGRDQAYRCGIRVRTARPVADPAQPRATALGVARFTGPGNGSYVVMRHRDEAGGWAPVSTAEPARQPEKPADPELEPGTIMLREGGVEMPLTGTMLHEYALAATDLFGQWSPWSTGSVLVTAPHVQTPTVILQTVRAAPGPGDADPCRLEVRADITWDRRERTCGTLQVVVDVADPTPPPPAPLANPPSQPQPAATALQVLVTFTDDGSPAAAPAGVDVVEIHDDGSPVSVGDPVDEAARRYRLTLGIDVAFGDEPEKTVTVYARAQEAIRPGEWSGWAHPQEAAIAANPLPPVPPPTPTPDFPQWASLPNAAALSYAPVTWAPTAARGYRLYEANEAALLSACGRPGPNLNEGYGARLQALFDLHADPSNHARLRAAFRKLGEEPVTPPVRPDGRMRCNSLLPRGSSLIHCFVVLAVSPTNVVSAWPRPGPDGRDGFLPYAIPRAVQPMRPEIRAERTDRGLRITVTITCPVYATAIRLYRGPSAVRARDVGTMQLIATLPVSLPADPGTPQQAVYLDDDAPTGWHRVHYRAVAVTEDDLDHGTMAVDSPATRSYPLLLPPSNPPVVTLTPDALGSGPLISMVRVATDAERSTTDIGDFALSWVATGGDSASSRGATSLPAMRRFPTPAALATSGLAASNTAVGYIGLFRDPFFAVRRHPTAATSLTVDVSDPLGRTTHVVTTIPAQGDQP